MRNGTPVYDIWWADTIGKITKITKRWTRVVWNDGRVWNYDKSHRDMFLREYVRGRKRERRR